MLLFENRTRKTGFLNGFCIEIRVYQLYVTRVSALSQNETLVKSNLGFGAVCTEHSEVHWFERFK
jgi:hypothetical protein